MCFVDGWDINVLVDFFLDPYEVQGLIGLRSVKFEKIYFFEVMKL